MGFTTAALILAGIGAGTQAVGSIKAGNAAKKAGQEQRAASESEAQLQEYNAAVADLQAKDAVTRGQEEENRFRQGVKAMVSQQRTGFAAGNIDVNFGSAVDVQADATLLGERDALTIRTNAAREAWGFQVQGEDLRKRAQIARKEGVYLEAAGKQQQTASRFQAAGGVLSTGSSLLYSRYGFNGGGTRSA
jgi:hypothetical protein